MEVTKEEVEDTRGEGDSPDSVSLEDGTPNADKLDENGNPHKKSKHAKRRQSAIDRLRD